MKRFLKILLRNILLSVVGGVVGIGISIVTGMCDYNIDERKIIFVCISVSFVLLVVTGIEFYKLGVFSESTDDVEQENINETKEGVYNYYMVVDAEIKAAIIVGIILLVLAILLFYISSKFNINIEIIKAIEAFCGIMGISCLIAAFVSFVRAYW